MDQSTQVNFPTGARNQHRKMKRHNTSGDLLQTSRGTQLNSSWLQLKPALSRPKSLNMSETINKSKYYNSDSPLSRLSIPITESLGSISRERSPPFSCNSSITSTTTNGYRNFQFGKGRTSQDEDSSGYSSKCCCCCRCYDNQSNESKYPRKTSADELSWKRLHMSRAKLKATSTTSELLSGFAMIAMVELQINEKTNVPEWLFVIFAVCTTILVSVHIFALMISTYILPNIDAIAKLDISQLVAESPHERMRGFIELAWAFSTVLGLFLFLVEVAILCWVKFWDYSFTAAIAATVIVIPVLIIFVLFAVHFYHSLVIFKVNSSSSDIQKLEDMKKQLDEITSQV